MRLNRRRLKCLGAMTVVAMAMGGCGGPELQGMQHSRNLFENYSSVYGDDIDKQGRELGGFGSVTSLPTVGIMISGHVDKWELSAPNGQLQAKQGSTILSGVFAAPGPTTLTKDSATLVIFDMQPLISPRRNAPVAGVTAYKVKYNGNEVCNSGWVLFVPGYWSDSTDQHIGDPIGVSIACVEDSAIAKCIDWGYTPYTADSAARDRHEICLRMARADYCGNGKTHTFENTPIDIEDARFHDGDVSNDADLPQKFAAAGDDSWKLEAVWGVDKTGSSNYPYRALCLSKLRWQTLPPDACISTPDPRTPNSCNKTEAVFCEEKTLSEWQRLGALFFTRSQFYDKGLYRWRQGTTDNYQTTTAGFRDDLHGSELPAPGFHAEYFEGLVFTKDTVDKLTPDVALLFSSLRRWKRGDSEIVLARESPDSSFTPSEIEGYVFQNQAALDLLPRSDREALGLTGAGGISQTTATLMLFEKAGRFVTSTQRPSADWVATGREQGIVVKSVTLPPPQASAPCTSRAWAWASEATGQSAYLPAAAYAYNSSAQPIIIRRPVQPRPGRYLVTFNGATATGSNLQVVSFGSAGERCKVATWTPPVAQVQCHNRTGQEADARFVIWLDYRSGALEPGEAKAYLLADEAKLSSYNPTRSPQWNTSGQLSTVSRSGLGRYTVTLTGQTSSYLSSVRVTAYGEDAAYCKVSGWGGNPVAVYVNCFAFNGTAQDSAFSLNFSRNRIFASNMSEGFVWTHSLTSTGYTPSTYYNFNAYGPGSVFNTAAHGTSIGQYWVDYPLLGTPLVGSASTAMVTAYGGDPGHCQIASWHTLGTSERVNIRCHSPLAGGTGAVDSLFVGSFVSNVPPLW